MTPLGTTRAYVRISLDTERSGSVEKQRERLTAAEVMAGRDADSIIFYVDEGVSGSREVKRLGRDALLADVTRGDRVIVTKIDRLARNVRDLLDIVKHIKNVGASIRFIDNDLNTDGPYGEFMLTVIAAIAELEAKIISERRKESLESFARQGRHAVGKAPFGFRSVDNPNGRGLVIRPDPDTAPIVQEAVRQVLAGVVQEQAREATGLSKTGFRHLLTNPRLAGMTPDGEGVVMIDGSPRIDPQAAILSLSEYRELQEYLRKPEKTWSRQDGYGRILLCGVCGDRLYKNVAKNPAHTVYRCRKVKHAKGQVSASVIASNAEAEVDRQFLDLVGELPHAMQVARDDESEKQQAVSAALTRFDELQRRLAATTDVTEMQTLAESLVEAQQERVRAEAMPVQSEEWEYVATGDTIRAVWERSSDDDREILVQRWGHFVVQPGRLPIDRKIVWQPRTEEEMLSGVRGEAFDAMRDRVRLMAQTPVGFTLLEELAAVTVVKSRKAKRARPKT